jgi:hypothetical protein
MDLVQEVREFARDYINGNQTIERKHKIAAAHRILFGESMNVGCGTCYVESLFKIIRAMDQKPRSYQLKPGVVLQSFSDASKTITNKSQDKDLEKIGMSFDHLCEWHLRNNPGCIRYFSAPSPDEIQRRLFNKPVTEDQVRDDGLRILKPVKDIIPEPEVLQPIEEKTEVKEVKKGRKPKK